MNTFSMEGIAGVSGVWTDITAAKGFDSALLNIPISATHFVRYTTGGTAALLLNELLTGGTSTKTCRLVAQAVEVGTAGSGDTGVLLLSNVEDGFTAAGETLTGTTSTGTAVTIQAPIPLMFHGMPRAVLLTIESADVLMSVGGVLPAISQNYGNIVSAGQNRRLMGINNIRTMKVINATADNGAVLKYELYW